MIGYKYRPQTGTILRGRHIDLADDERWEPDPIEPSRVPPADLVPSWVRRDAAAAAQRRADFLRWVALVAGAGALWALWRLVA